jgi:hypothetical protein
MSWVTGRVVPEEWGRINSMVLRITAVGIPHLRKKL